MNLQTTQYQPPRARRSNPVMVLELDDLELLDEPVREGWRGHRFPPAISDSELSQLVDACTSELCQRETYQYIAFTG